MSYNMSKSISHFESHTKLKHWVLKIDINGSVSICAFSPLSSQADGTGRVKKAVLFFLEMKVPYELLTHKTNDQLFFQLIPIPRLSF